MDERDRNRISLWRKFDAGEKQPIAKGDGLVGENDYRICGSMWPSRKGEGAKGPWQVWSVSLRPAQGETRKLVAVPPEMLDRVLALIRGGDASAQTPAAGSAPAPATPPQPQEEFADELPF
jgi:hypothetical protein